MDAVSNPYTPRSGVAPADLAGRDAFRSTTRVVIERMRRGLPAKNLLFVGLRGVGKTVLLDRMRCDAAADGNQTVHLRVPGRRSLPALLAPEMRLVLLSLSRHEAGKQASIRALRALSGFTNALKYSYPDIAVGMDFEPESGLADSGVLQQDLQALFESAGEAARHVHTGVVLFIDEMQFLPAAELAPLTIALHHCAQRGLPLALVGAGLPQLRGLVIDAEASAEGLFDVFELGPLSTEAAARTLRAPAAALDVQFEEAAVNHILAATQCYPYFLQELAKQAWDIALQSPITLQDTHNAARFALAALDEKFFRVRFDRLTPTERKYIRAMAELGPGPHRSGDIAKVMRRPVTSLGPSRSQLIAKGVLWSPGHGDTAFAVPRFDEYLRRTWPGNSWRN